MIVVEDEGVKLGNGNVERCAIGLVKDERLLIRIEACARGHSGFGEEEGEVLGMVLEMSAESLLSMVFSESRRCDIEETHRPAVELQGLSKL